MPVCFLRGVSVSVENLHYYAPGTHVPRCKAGMSNRLSFLQLSVPTADYKPGSHT